MSLGFKCEMIGVVLLIGALEVIRAESGKTWVHPSEATEILLRSHTIDTTRQDSFLEEAHTLEDFAGMSAAQRLDSELETLFFVHLSQVTQEITKSLQSKFRIDFSHYLPHNTFIVRCTHAMAQALQEESVVTWIGNVHPQHKIVSDFTGSELLKSFKGSVEVHAPQDEQEIVSIVERLSHHRVKIVNHYRFIFEADSEESWKVIAERLCHEPTVRSISLEVEYKTFNANARSVVLDGSNRIPDFGSQQGSFFFSEKLEGQNQIVGVADSGIEYRSCFFANTEGTQVPLQSFRNFVPNARPEQMTCGEDFQKTRKIVQYVAFGDDSDSNPIQQGHGTHVAGSIAGYPVNGYATSNGEFSGIAPQARIAFFDVADATTEVLKVPDDVGRDMFSWAYQATARIHTNSWGSLLNAYTAGAAETDKFVYENKDFLVLFAAGNSGECDSRGSIGAPATAKNALSVGATMNTFESWQRFRADRLFRAFGENYSSDFTEESIAFFSSIGPTYDGRLKPDVLGVGYYVGSASNIVPETATTCAESAIDDNIAFLAGTSMATPTIAGAAAVLRQYFMEGFYPTGSRNDSNAFTPSASLMKAVLINSAVQLKGVKHSLPDPFFTVSGVTCNISRNEVPQRPSIFSGYGRVKLTDAMHILSLQTQRFVHIPSLDANASDVFFDKSISTNETHAFEYCVLPNPNEEVRITLVWTDPVASALARLALVNNLDLRVRFQGKVVPGNSKPMRNPILNLL